MGEGEQGDLKIKIYKGLLVFLGGEDSSNSLKLFLKLFLNSFKTLFKLFIVFISAV